MSRGSGEWLGPGDGSSPPEPISPSASSPPCPPHLQLALNVLLVIVHSCVIVYFLLQLAREWVCE